MGGVFTYIHSVLVTAQTNDITVFGYKNPNNQTNEIVVGRRPITNENKLTFLVLGHHTLT